MQKLGRPKVLTDKERNENQRRAVKDWGQRHKKEVYRIQKKSRAKSFIIKDATREELLELRDFIDERLKETK